MGDVTSSAPRQNPIRDGRVPSRWRRSGWALVLVVVLLGVALPAHAQADAAPGWFAGHTTDQQHAIVNWVYRGGPQGTTPYAGTPQTLGASLYSTETSTSQTVERGGELVSELLVLRQTAGVLPKLIERSPGDRTRCLDI